MKKLYTLSLVLFACVASFAQTFYSENFGTPSGTTLFPAYTTGTAPATFQNGAPITYTGTADVRTSNPSSGYSGASGSGLAFLGTTAGVGKDMIIGGLNTAAYSSANLNLTFGYKIESVSAGQMILEQSIDGSTWTPITFTPNAGTTWTLVTVPGSVIASSATLSLRFANPGGSAQVRIDDIKLSNVSATCALVLGTETAACDASTIAMDTYTVTIPFTGGGTATYGMVASSGTIGGDNPSSTEAGNITISGIVEGTSLIFNLTGGTCTLTKEVTAPTCKATNELPFNEPFNYDAGASLQASQAWTALNTGDNMLIAEDNLSYTGVASTGNAVTFTGTGADAVAKFTPVTSGTVYASFLMKVSDFGTLADAPASTYFAALAGTSNTTYHARAFFKKTGEQYQLGLANLSTATDENFAPTAFGLGDVVLVVLGYDFDTTTIKMWINPVVATFNASTPATLSMELALDPAIANVGGFLLRQDDNARTPSITIDELRVGTSTGDVLATSNNTISGLKVYPNPVSNGTLFIETSANADKAVVIYDIVGKQVLNTKTSSNNVNVSNLKGGVYFVNITEEGRTATMKLVVR